MQNIKWINKMSRETGYVGKISKKNGYFINTSEKSEARKFRSAKEVETAMKILESFGEFVNNDFVTEEA